MVMIYWTEIQEGVSAPKSKEFASEKMTEALQFTEVLRTKQRAGEILKHITLSSENPHSVGRAGVDVTGSDYDWKKRRTQ